MCFQVCQSVFEEFPELARLSRSQAYRALSNPKYCGKMKVSQLITCLYQIVGSRSLVIYSEVPDHLVLTILYMLLHLDSLLLVYWGTL